MKFSILKFAFNTMGIKVILIVFALEICQIICCEDYYWKEYSGTIPADAFPAGNDVAGRSMYIGQAYVHGHGIFVVQIYPGVTELDIACYGFKKVDKIVKILCSKHPERFSWLKTSAQSFHVDTIRKHAVVGGFDQVDNNKGMVHVGRLTYQGVLKIGGVGGYALEHALFYFPHANAEHKAESYEVLLYDLPHNQMVSQNFCCNCTNIRVY